MYYNLESSTVTFSGTDTATYTFAQTYTIIPIVTALADQGVNIYVESVTLTQAVIRSSQKGFFTAYVHVFDSGSPC